MLVRTLLLTGLMSGVVLAQGSGTQAPRVALDGYCAVCIVKADKLVEGSRAYSSVYDGKKYLFPSAEQKATFDENPAAFAPALGGDCVVCEVEMDKRIPGKPEFRVVHDGRLYLFPSEKQLEMFKANPEKYADVDVALDGYCTVCKVEMGKEVEGKPEFAIDYRGMRYLFPSEKQLEMFRQNPKKYAVK